MENKPAAYQQDSTTLQCQQLSAHDQPERSWRPSIHQQMSRHSQIQSRKGIWGHIQAIQQPASLLTALIQNIETVTTINNKQWIITYMPELNGILPREAGK